MGWNIAQVIEVLLSMNGTLGSIPRTAIIIIIMVMIRLRI
jgi:hypothetical protein